MNAKKFFGLIIVTISISIIFSASLMAWGFGYHGHKKYGWGDGSNEQRIAKIVEHIGEELALDSSQIKALNQFKEELIAKKQDLRSDKEEIMAALIQQTRSDSFDTAQFQLLADRHIAKTKLAVPLIIEKATQFHEVLNETQKKLLVNKINEMRPRRVDRKGRKDGRFNKTPRKRAGFMIERLTSKLDLNEAQVQAFNSVKDALFAEKEKMFGGSPMFQFQQMIAGEISSDKLDSTKIKNVVYDKINNRAEMIKLVINKYAELHAVLNPEQRDLIADKMEDHLKWMTKRDAKR